MDRGFAVAMALCASSVFAIVILVLVVLVARSRLSLQAFGAMFFFRSDWDPVHGSFGALPFLFGTLATSVLALLIAVPLSLGVAVFLTEMCPHRRARRPRHIRVRLRKRSLLRQRFSHRR